MNKKNNNSGQVNYFNIGLYIFGVLTGLLIATQCSFAFNKLNDIFTPYTALQKLNNNLSSQNKQLKAKISAAQSEANAIESELANSEANSDLINQLAEYKQQSGLTELIGSGIIITLDDSTTVVGSSGSIAHAADLRDIVNFALENGAQTISINNERIVFSSSIDCIINTVLINNTKTTAPFEIKIIGDEQKLFDQFTAESSLAKIKQRVDESQLIFTIKQSDEIVIPAYQGSFIINNAQISN